MTYFFSFGGSGTTTMNDLSIVNDLAVGDDATIYDKLNLSNSIDDEGEIIIFSGANNDKGIDLRNTGTGNSIFINQDGNGIALNIDSGATNASSIKIESQNTSGDVFFIRNTAIHSSGQIISIIQDNASSSANVLQIDNDGSGMSLLLNQDGNGIALNIDSEATSKESISIDAVNTSGIIVDINLVPGASSSAKVLRINNTSDCTERVVELTNSGTNSTIYLNQEGVLASSKRGLEIYSNSAQTNSNLAFFKLDNDSSTQSVIRVVNDGIGSAQIIDMNGATGNALEIDQDSNDGGDVYAVKIVSDNAGAGSPGGIDMSSFSIDEPLIKCPNDAITSAGTLTKQIAIDIGGTTYYLYAYTTGS